MSPIALTESNFNEEIIAFHGPAVVTCERPWTGSTYIMSAIIERLTKTYGARVKFATLDIQNNRRICEAYSIGDAALLFFKEGNLVEVKSGVVSGDEIESCVNKILLGSDNVGGEECTPP